MNSVGWPRGFIVDGDWPTGTIDNSAPPIVTRLARAATLLAAWMYVHNTPAAELAETADVPVADINGLLDGTAVASIETLARLEMATDLTLWP